MGRYLHLALGIAEGIMEFEITSEGELIKYHGKGGDVVIPEGVKFIEIYSSFDNEDLSA